jgi:hypothetical protein
VIKTALSENILIISEDETGAEGNQLIKLQLKGRKKGDLKKVKAAVIEVPLIDLAEYENDAFTENDRKKLQMIEEQLGQIVTLAFKENLQKVQQLFVETPGMVYDSVLLYEPQDIPGIDAWPGLRQILERTEFADVRQYFIGDAKSLKGMDSAAADNFATAMAGLIAAGSIEKNSAAALKIQQLARQVTEATDIAGKTRYVSMLAMLGKGLSEKTLMKYAVAETKTEEFHAAENNRLFGQLLLRKALKTGVTPESLVNELESLAPAAAENAAGFNDIRGMLKQVIATGQLPSREELARFDAKRVSAFIDNTMEQYGGDINAKKKNGFLRFLETINRFFTPEKAAERQIEKNQYVSAATRVLTAMKEQGDQDPLDELLRILYLYSDRKVKAVQIEERIEIKTVQAILGAA